MIHYLKLHSLKLPVPLIFLYSFFPHRVLTLTHTLQFTTFFSLWCIDYLPPTLGGNSIKAENFMTFVHWYVTVKETNQTMLDTWRIVNKYLLCINRICSPNIQDKNYNNYLWFKNNFTIIIWIFNKINISNSYDL